MRRTRRWTVRSGATLVAAAVLLGGLPAPVSMSAAQAGAELSTPIGVRLGRASAVGTIVDDD